MIVELGNHAAHRGVDDAPKVTTIHIPDADEQGLGGYSHAPGLDVNEFRKHRAEAADFRDGLTHLPDHEALLAICAAWPAHARSKPEWVKVTGAELTPDGHEADIEQFLQEFYGIEREKPGNVEDLYWTKFGPPGQGGPVVPDLKALLTNDGRTQQGNSQGGGQVGSSGTGTAASVTTLTTASTYTLNQWAGYRVYCFNGTAMVWGNVISNTAGANSVLTVDRWYNAATPGGAAATAPASGFQFLIADGGGISSWFVGLTTTNITPAATDHALSGEYTTAGGGFIRKIAPYSLTSGTSPLTYTLTPVFTGNGSDTYPSTFYALGVFNSMVVSDQTLAMKFETLLNASATVAASGDQITATETVTGS